MAYGAPPESYGAPPGSYGAPNTYAAQPGQFGAGYDGGGVAVAQAVPVAVAQPVYGQAVHVPQAQPVYGQPPQNPGYQPYQAPQAVGHQLQPMVAQFDKSNSRNIMCCWGMAIFFGLCVLVGAVALMVVGGRTSREVATMEPGSDFVVLPNTCVVTQMEHCWSTTEETERRNGRKVRIYECHDTFTFKFSTSSEAGLQSEEHSSHRGQIDCGSGCDTSAQSYSGSPYSVGDATTCWAPAQEDGYSSLYRCPNEGCIKLFDPEIDVGLAKNMAYVFNAVGAGLLIMSLIGMSGCAGCCFCGVAAQKRRVVAFPPQPYYPPQQVPQYNPQQPRPMNFDPHTGEQIVQPAVPVMQVQNAGPPGGSLR